MKITRTLLLAALAACVLATPLPAQVPQLLNVQGRVAASGVNFNGTGQFKFALVNSTGSTTFWSNDGTSTAGSEPTAAVSLPVANGLYSALLGDTALANMQVIPATVFNNADVRLRVWFNDGTNGSQLLTPDQRIAAVGYAIMAGNVPDGAITSAKIAAGAVGTAQLASGAVGSTQLASGAVQSSNIAPGTILPTVVVTGTSQAAVANTSYTATGTLATTIDLANTTAAIGDIVQITGAGSGGWNVVGTGNANYWTPHDIDRGWNAVASSADGSKLVAAAGDGIYTSTDYGLSWTQREGNRPWAKVASSANGTKLVATLNATDRIYTSADSGVNWIPRATSQLWLSLASSADGTKLFAVAGGMGLFTSTDSGVTWTLRVPNVTWSNIASSADGTKLVAAETNTQIFTSADSGASWTPRESQRKWAGLASSADGTKLVAVDGGLGATGTGGKIYTSTDSGVTWTPRETNRLWNGVASSADGTKLVATVNGLPPLPTGKIYTSTDSGLSWTPQESDRDWRGVTSSTDGTKLVAVAYGGRIYTNGLPVSQGATATLQYQGSGEWSVLGSAGSAASLNGSVTAENIPAGLITGSMLANGSIVDAHINSQAGIAAHKLGTGVVTTTEFNRLNGVTSDIQPQLNAKLSLSGGTLTGGLTAPSFAFSTPQTRYMAVPAAAFRPASSITSYSSGTNGVIFTSSAGGPTNFTAPVMLPHGAVITGMKFVGLDNDAGINLNMVLRSAVDTSSSSTTVASVTTAGASATAQEVSSGAVSKTVDNLNERLFLNAFWDTTAGSSIDIRQVVITYTVTNPNP